MALLLFDMDGTLVKGKSSYSTTMEYAIKSVFYKEARPDTSRFHGSTDRLVLKATLTENNIPFNEKYLNRCLRLFEQIYPKGKVELELIPGVRETIPLLVEEHFTGLLTGNVEKMARVKLDLFDMNKYFPFGGFGSDPHEIRADLVEVALKRVRRLGWNGSLDSVYVIGDTPKDHEAAKISGTNSILVSTGVYNEEQLRVEGAKTVIPNMKDLLELDLS